MAGRRETHEANVGEVSAKEYSEPGHSLVHTDLSYPGYLLDKFVVSQDTLDFAARRKCGEILPYHPFEVQKIETFRVAGDISIFGPTTSVEGSYWGEYPRLISLPAIDATLRDVAIITAASKAASAQWDYLTFLAEAKDTIKLIKALGTQFNRQTKEVAVDAVRKFRENPWKYFRDNWLTARYGIRPIIFDIQSAVNAFTEANRKYIFGRARQLETLALNASTTFDIGGRYDATIMESLTGSVQYRGFAACKTDVFVGSAYGADPILTAWEIIPYSFVIDRLINIGDWLSTLRPQITGGYAALGFSVKREYQHLQRVSIVPKPPWTGDFGDFHTTLKVKHYTRDPSPIPGPPFNPRLDWPFIVDLAALFIGGSKVVGSILATRGKPLYKYNYGKGRPHGQ